MTACELVKVTLTLVREQSISQYYLSREYSPYNSMKPYSSIEHIQDSTDLVYLLHSQYPLSV